MFDILISLYQSPLSSTAIEITGVDSNSKVGDGTTSVVLLAGEFLKQAKPYIEEGLHPQIIAKAYRKASKMAIDRLREIAVKVSIADSSNFEIAAVLIGYDVRLEISSRAQLNSRMFLISD